MRSTEMPAVRAAAALAPTARIWKPSVERSISHQNNASATSATMRPECSLMGPLKNAMRAAESATLGVIGWFEPGFCHAGCVNT